jgi:PAS domain-containing protein
VSGNIVGVIGVGQDVTERKKAELKMTRVAKELQTFIDTANAPIFGIDAYGLVNEWNNMAAKITGFTRHEVMNQSCHRLRLSFFLLTESSISPRLKPDSSSYLYLALTFGWWLRMQWIPWPLERCARE